MELIDDFQQRLGYTFASASLLREALTHPSYHRQQKAAGAHNQRLEFLGDAVLQLAVTVRLYAMFPQAPEGELTKLRSRIVSREHLARLARSIDLGAALLLGPGEERNAGRDRESSLADAMESVLGAIHLDGGWDQSNQLILRLMETSFQELLNPDSAECSNAKGTLQEYLQKNGGEPPNYQCIEMAGEAHDRQYTVALLWQGRELARGTGKSKRAAETEAARIALAEITKIGSSALSIE
jgi:ribonuclease-3